MSNPPKGYRPNVGIVVFNSKDLVLLCHRAGEDGPFAWQFPQGGIDKGEDPEAAARRELDEETGIGGHLITPLAQVEDWLTYDFPPHLRALPKHKGRLGQAQKWFAYRFSGQDADIRLDTRTPEFDDWRWARLSETPELIIPWKRGVYEKVAEAFAPFAC